MGLRSRLIWVAKTYRPEVFLRVVAVVQGQYEGGMRGHHGLDRTAWDVIAPPYALTGENHPVTPGLEDWTEDIPSPAQLAEWLRRWLEAVVEYRWTDAYEVMIETGNVVDDWTLSTRLPDDSVYAPMIPWVAKLVNLEVKQRTRWFKRGEWTEARFAFEPGEAPSRAAWMLASMRSDLQRAWSKSARRERGIPALTEQDVYLADVLTLLSQNLGQVADWWVAHPDVDLLGTPLHDALNAANAYHALLRDRMDREAATGSRGAVVYTWDDGWTAQALVSREQLEAEGVAMGHCAEDYFGRVQSGSVAVVSIRDARGVPHVTLELQLQELDEEDLETYRLADAPVAKIPEHGGSPDVQHAVVVQVNPRLRVYLPLAFVVQAKGKENAVPHPKYARYVREFLSFLPTEVWGEANWMRPPATFAVEMEATSPSFDWHVRRAHEASRDEGHPVAFPRVTIRKQVRRLKKEGTDSVEVVRLYGMIKANAWWADGWEGVLDQFEWITGASQFDRDREGIPSSWFDSVMRDLVTGDDAVRAEFDEAQEVLEHRAHEVLGRIS